MDNMRKITDDFNTKIREQYNLPKTLEESLADLDEIVTIFKLANQELNKDTLVRVREYLISLYKTY